MQDREPSVTEKMLEPKPLMLNHIGYDCKSYALSAALNWLYQSNLITIKPPPPRKREDASYNNASLRWLLKKYYHSKVGEVHNVEDLASVAMMHEQVVSHYGECETKDEYNNTLKKSIDLGRPAIVFFDAGNNNHPTNNSGISEHSALVIGYKTDKKKNLTFDVTQYGDYYQFDADNLFESANQLPKSRNTFEKYYKIRSKRNNYEGAWIAESYATLYKIKYIDSAIKSAVETNPTSNKGLGRKILILDSKIHPQPELSSLFKKNIPTVKLEDSEPDTLCKINCCTIF